MPKRGRGQKRNRWNGKRKPLDEYKNDPRDMDDEIDAFHKQRDIIPLNISGDATESSEDEEDPVFNDEDIDGSDGDDDDEEEEEEEDDDAHDTTMAKKIARQQKFLRAKFGGVDDEMPDDDVEEEGKRSLVWGGKKDQYYNADNYDFELQSSDDEAPIEEEAEVLRLQREKAKSLSLEDFGLEDIQEDGSDRELTLEEIPTKRKRGTLLNKDVDQMDADFEVKKDLNALSREEQMDVVYSSAPELVGLLSELNDTLEQLETRVNPAINQVKNSRVISESGIRYVEAKQLLLLSYCQAITFYLLLKSEGLPVRDHPIIGRLVEIKGLLDKMKQLDGNTSLELEEILKENHWPETEDNVENDTTELLPSISKDHKSVLISASAKEEAEPDKKNELIEMESPRGRENPEGRYKHKKHQVAMQSIEMLKVRAALEEKLRQKGVFTSVAPKSNNSQKQPKPANRKLETNDDFDDDALNIENGRVLSNGKTSEVVSTKLSQLVNAKLNKRKVISGDDDLPKRDDIGERRRKYELRVLAGAGIKSDDDADNEIGIPGADGASDMQDSDSGSSEDDFYKQVKEQRAARLAAKADVYLRSPQEPLLPEIVDGKRQISSQIEKNRGLTRHRKKLTKNPRKKYRTKHKEAQTRRKGQVREIKKPSGPYGGETSGINVGISRSIRF
ncbi:hypothetical protein K2173_020314 [Erythroxylum novogranatense]|uniref:Sas10 C-terminal domain-containing protein n=1 Tax=Erythroxylum novogranatense TaxID=1862640 RepID=A0AAV8UAE3_9ROSI|nr:hypothetical protein K2173_020314 [Erythroxylum novogranatense]